MTAEKDRGEGTRRSLIMSDMPQPVSQHEALARRVGRWNVACKFFMGPMEVSATETAEMHGAFFLTATFEATMIGAEMRGLTTMGYSPVTGKYQATWADTFSPHLMYFEGEYDEAGEVLTMTTRAPAPGNGSLMNWRTTE